MESNLPTDSLYDRLNINAYQKLVEKLKIVRPRHERHPGPEIGRIFKTLTLYDLLVQLSSMQYIPFYRESLIAPLKFLVVKRAQLHFVCQRTQLYGTSHNLLVPL